MMNVWLIRRAVRRPVLLVGHLPHELVGVQAALHQQLALLDFVNQRHRLCRGRLAVRGVDDLEAIDIDPVLAGHGGDLRGRPD